MASKLPSRSPRWPQGGPKMAPRWPQERTRRPQDGPKWPQDGPKTPQGGSKTAPSGPKMAPRWPQDGPKTAQDGFKSPKQLLARPTRKPHGSKLWQARHFYVHEVYLDPNLAQFGLILTSKRSHEAPSIQRLWPPSRLPCKSLSAQSRPTPAL